MNHYQKSISEVEKEFQTDIKRGLTLTEAKKRLAKYGQNTLPTKPPPPAIVFFLNQFKDILIIILIAAATISLLLGDKIDALAITAIILLNATLGFLQELKAQKTLDSLKQKEILFTLVLRNNNVEKIPSAEVVPGDILILEEGEKVPADARIVESFSLIFDESILTGESHSVPKNSRDLTANLPLADRKNMIYKDTQILSGRGKAVVVATGKDTEIGKIAQILAEVKKEKTPITRELEKVAQTLTYIILIISGLIFFLNLAQDIPLVESLLVSISLSVAAIPEGLPAIVTIVLSLGVKKLADQKTIIKKLPAVETLGAIKIIATDKTGTITQNKINAVRLGLPDNHFYTVEGNGYSSRGTYFNDKKQLVNDPFKHEKLKLLLTCAVLANNSVVEKDPENPKVIGDTTEAALVVAARRAKLDVKMLRNNNLRVFEAPFTSERKMMSVVVRQHTGGNYLLYAKGAPEVMIDNCQLTSAQRKLILETSKDMAKKGLRSLLFAYKKVTKSQVDQALGTDKITESGLKYLGVVGMQDPLRLEVKQALIDAKKAGIRTIMITGDHKETAQSIAIEAGISNEGDKILTENEVEKYSLSRLSEEIKKGVNVFARISPMGKLKIIEAIKKIPHMQVAVTGDGVNDAPALRASHIGIAMGQTGTDITREVADMVITDDNYATIVDAIKEGRMIFANLVKFIRYLISCNLSEVLVVTAGVLFQTPIPLLPIQILWINLVTDGFPALALGVDPPERDIMNKPPRDLSVPLLHKKRWGYMMIEGAIIGVTVFALYLFALNRFDYKEAQTATFTALAFSQLIHAFNNRSTRKSIFQLGIFTNKYLVVAAIISIILQIFVIHTNLGNLIFKTEPLSLSLWLYTISASLIPLWVVEVKKQLRFRILP